MKSEDFIEITIPNVSGENKFWLIYNAVRRDLFGFLKKEITRLPWGEAKEDFVSLMKEVASELPRVWEKIKSEYKDNQNLVYRLSGAYYESLFYAAHLIESIVYTEAQHLIYMGKEDRFPGDPPYQVVLPIFEVVPRMFWFTADSGEEKRYAPQARADFILLRRAPDDEEAVIYLVEIKRSEPKDKFIWETAASLLGGAVYMIAFPKSDVEVPIEPEHWITHVVCAECGKWPITNGVCENCGHEWLDYSRTSE